MVETTGWNLVVVIVVLTAVAVTVAAANHLGVARQVGYAVVRACLQLAAVSLILVVVLKSGWLTAAFITLMVVVGAVTSWRRIGAGPPLWTAFPIVCGTAPVLVAVITTGVIPIEPIAVLPIAGIIIGNAMNGTSVVGRLARQELEGRRGEYEAALSLGFLERDAALMLTRPQAATAMVPSMDQTRTVGLVTLPGAFIGVLLGGGTPAEAGAAQILVLAGVLAAQSVAVVVTIEMIARGLAARPSRTG